MKRKEIIFVGIVLCFIVGLFFHKFLLNGYIPFPGDLLIHDYSPWKYYSYLGYNPGSYPTKLQYFDVLRQLYPWKIFVIEQLKNGYIPLWNPYNFAGAPLLANLQSQVFAPFNILYFIFPYVYSWSIGLILQTVLAFIFAYLYARKMQFHPEGAVFAAIAFSCSLYLSVFFEYGVFGHTIIWLPLVLLGIESLLEKLSIKSLLLIVIAITFSAFGGHLQVFSYVVAFACIYSVVRLLQTKKNTLSKTLFIVFAFVMAIGISSIQLFPTLELIQLSARAAFEKQYFLHNLLLKTNELILFLSPDFYGNPATNNFLLSKSYPQTALYIGIIPLIFALSVIFLKKNVVVKFYLTTAIITLLGVTDNPLSVFFYSLQLPFLSSSSPTNSIFLISFSLSMLSGYAFDQWLLKKNRFPFFVALSFGLLLALAFGLHKVLHTDFSSKNVLYSFVILGAFLLLLSASKFIRSKKIIAIVFIVLTIFDLFYFFQKFNPFVPKSFVFPKTEITNIIQQRAGIDRVWGYGGANILSNTNSVFSFASPDGYDPLYPKSYGEFLYSSNDGKLLKKFTMTTRSNATLNSSFGVIPGNKKAQKIINVLGVRYVIDRIENASSEKTFPPDTFKLLYDSDGWKLYENKLAVPRIFLTTDYQIYTTNKDFEKKFFAESFNPMRTLLLEERPSFERKENNEKGDSVQMQAYKPNEIALQVNANTKKLLFLSDTYYPGWKAFIDGREVPILRTDYTFRSVVVPQGNHSISFIYKPLVFFYGYMTTLISVGILIVVSIIIYVRKSFYEN